MRYWFNCFNVIFLVQPGESSQKGPVRRVQSGRCMGGPARNVQPRRTSRKGPVMRVQPGRSRGVQPGRSNPKSSANSVQPRDLDPEWDPLSWVLQVSRMAPQASKMGLHSPIWLMIFIGIIRIRSTASIVNTFTTIKSINSIDCI